MMNTLWSKIFLGNSVKDWSVTIGLIIILFLAITIIKRIALVRLKKWALKTATTFDDFIITVIEKSVVPFAYLACFYYAITTLALPAWLDRGLKIIFLLGATFYILRIITAAIKHFVFSFLKRQENSETKEKQARGLLIILNIIIWVLGAVFIVDNLGYKVSTLVAGLGIGGIAIALAAQAILGDLFAYFVIFFDRPFEYGDFIIVDDKMGTVEYIGIKTTRLRTLGGEQLVCSNKDLTSARVHNYKKMEQRRVVFQIGVTYQTTYEQLKAIPDMIKNIIKSKDEVRLDRGNLASYGDFSIIFEFVYYVLSADYNIYMNIQESIYLDIFKTFEKENIEFAYPTQSIFLNMAANADLLSKNNRPDTEKTH